MCRRTTSLENVHEDTCTTRASSGASMSTRQCDNTFSEGEHYIRSSSSIQHPSPAHSCGTLVLDSYSKLLCSHTNCAACCQPTNCEDHITSTLTDRCRGQTLYHDEERRQFMETAAKHQEQSNGIKNPLLF